jgi:hypothetical protein
MPFVPWYLQQMKQYQDDQGVRLLDYLDLHYYPQAPGVALSPAGTGATQALRLRSTRALWDSTYVDESWIKDAGPDGGIVKLIPRMRAWVDQYYPGTKLAVSEYNWGALDDINGALAQADVLGIFGREGLDLATLWGPPDATAPGAFAFRLYRNYDGEGAKFGDVSVQAASSDQDKLSIYAAHRTGDNKLTVMVINKSLEEQTGALSLGNLGPVPAAAYRYSAGDTTKISNEGGLILESGVNRIKFPAQSITLILSDAPAISYSHYVYLPAMRR